jgi:hypothetical protein
VVVVVVVVMVTAAVAVRLEYFVPLKREWFCLVQRGYDRGKG